MLKIKNKEGKVVMEMSDNGDVKINDAKLEESFENKTKTVKEEQK